MSRSPLTGWLLALLAAACFGTSGSFASSLLATGWSPASVVTVRLGLGALLLAPLAVRAMHGRWSALRRTWPVLVVYGVVACAVCQVCYFYAVQRLSVGVALLLEYLGPIFVVIWIWITTRVRPGTLTAAGALLSIGGLALVLDLTGEVRVDGIGVLFGLGAAVCLAVYFVVSARIDDDLPPVALACGGLLVATLSLLAFCGVGLLPWGTATTGVRLAGATWPWWVPLLGLGLVAAAVAYLVGNTASRRLGSRMASFAGLTEVLFAVLWAWLWLGERLTAIQLLGGLVVLAGVAAVKADEVASARRARRATAQLPEPTS